MPARTPPASIARLLQPRTDAETPRVDAPLAAALLDAVRDIHGACDRHRSHASRSVTVLELDTILGRHLRPHLDPASGPEGTS